MRLGRQSDLARELGISRSAVSQAFKKHNVQTPMDGKFDLDYYAWLLKEKQDQVKSKAQRTANKQPSGIKNPRVRREVVRHLHAIWEEAVIETLRFCADGMFEHETDISRLMDALIYMGIFWDRFHEICDREFPAELTDFPFKEPAVFQFDVMTVDAQKYIESIVGYRLGTDHIELTDSHDIGLNKDE